MKNCRLLTCLAFLCLAGATLSAQAPDPIRTGQQIDSLLDLATGYYTKRELTKMNDAALAAGELAAGVFGKMTDRYANCLIKQGQAQGGMNRYDRAEPLYAEAVDILGKVPTLDSLAYPKAQIMLANAYHFMGKNEKAESLLLEARESLAKKAGTRHMAYLDAVNSLGNFYNDTGQYRRADPLFREAQTVLEQLDKHDTPEYAKLLNNIGLLNISLYRYDQAESAFTEAIAIMKRIGATQDRNYPSILHNYGELFHRLGQYDRAEALYLECKAVRAQLNGTNHPAYGVLVMNLGILYNDMGLHTQAEPYLLEAREIFSNRLGKESAHYGVGSSNLADLYRNMGRYDQAEPLYAEAVEVIAHAIGKESADYFYPLMGFAVLNVYQGKFEDADRRFEEARTLLLNFFGPTSPEYATLTAEIAELDRGKGQYARADSAYLDAHAVNMKYLGYLRPCLPPADFAALAGRTAPQPGRMASIRQDRPSAALDDAALNGLLFFQSAAIRNRFELQRSLSRAPKEVQSRFWSWVDVRKQMADEYVRPLGDPDQLRNLQHTVDDLEDDLSARLPGFSELLVTDDWKAIRNNLRPDEAAVQFTRFAYYRQHETDSVLYGAWVLRSRDARPRFVYLFEEKQLRDGLAAGPASAALYPLVWQPLDSLLKGAKNVYYAPAGLLYQVAFDALAVKTAQPVLADRYRLHAVSVAGRQASDLRLAPADSQTAALYALPEPALTAKGAQPTPVLANGVQQELSRAGVKMTLWSPALDAGQPTGAVSSPSILHLVIRSAAQAGETGGDMPRSQSGIVFSVPAGAQAPEYAADGLLTAAEIGHLDLHLTRLVVLESAPGAVVTDPELLHSLHQAFQRAGVQYVLLRIAPVPAGESEQFAATFYRYCLKGEPIPKAFLKTQRKIRQSAPGSAWWAWRLLE